MAVVVLGLVPVVAAVFSVELLSDYRAFAFELADFTGALGDHHVFAAQPPQFDEVELASIEIHFHSGSLFSSICVSFLQSLSTASLLSAEAIFCFMNPESRFAYFQHQKD